MSADVLEPWVTTADVAAYLKKPKSWVYDNGHRIPRYKIGATYRYRLSQVAAWVESQGATGPAEGDVSAPTRLTPAGE